MKSKFSLNALLHNNKLMMGFSVVAAIAIWASVAYGVGSTITRTITIPTNLDLSGSYAGVNGMQIYEGATQQVSVKVSGSWSVVNSLNQEDILVSGDYTKIMVAGTWKVNLTPAKNSSKTDYEFVSWYPKTADIMCDSARTVGIKVEADISNVSVAESSDVQLGTPVIQASGLENNTVQIEGPKSEINRIASVVAKVETPTIISEATPFTTALKALDVNGNELNLEHCNFIGLTENKVNITVPVVVHRTVNFTYTLENLPPAFDKSTFCTVSPASIELVGSPDQVETFATTIENLGTFDFNHLTLTDVQKKIALNVPQGVRVLDSTTEVTVSFDMQGLGAATVDLPLTTGNIQVINLPSGRKPVVSYQTISGITLIGNSASIAKIKASDLSVVIDMENDNTVGPLLHQVTINIPGYNDVWVYYGAAETSGYEIYLSINKS